MTNKIKLPLIVKIIIAIISGILIGQIAPNFAIRLGNTLCGLFGQLLNFFVPLIIIGFVTPAIAEVGGKAGKMLLTTVVIAYSFTVISGLFAYLFSVSLFPGFIPSEVIDFSKNTAVEYAPYFKIAINPLMDVMSALVLAFLLGLGLAACKSEILTNCFYELRVIMEKAIACAIIPFLPFYIFGIFMDMTAAGKVAPVLTSLITIVIIIFVMTILMLCFQYCVAGLITRKNPFKLLLTMMPAYFTALGTSSSVATIPVTLKRSIKNGVSKPVADFVIPLCATIHLSGSTLKLTSCAIALMMMQKTPFSFMDIFGYVLMLGVTMVAAPGVPGGAVMAALGVMSAFLGFGEQQQAMMIALYIAMDSFGTACNVTGDCSIALIVNKLYLPKDIKDNKVVSSGVIN